ncbi:hypothetical protein GGS21DRAFT_80736 [Xylaria nigripes]|nr:hypothetical protein GGS21DRAFT_80736 [Xylaria nigripes]
MADASVSMFMNAGAMVAAAASASRYRGLQNARVQSDTRTFDTARYMNSLRMPAPPINPARALPKKGASIHVHYQASCPHGDDCDCASSADNLVLRGDSSVRPPNRNWTPQIHLQNQNTPVGTHPACDPSQCGCARCYYKAFLSDDIQRYTRTCEKLDETYAWNTRELLRRHQASPNKTRREKDRDFEKLYWYYVGRLREVYENHCEHHLLLFQDRILLWLMPEMIILRDEDVASPSEIQTPLSRHSSDNVLPSSNNQSPPAIRESESQCSLDTTRRSKGKEKEAIDASDANMQIASVKEAKGKEKELLNSSDTNIRTSSVYEDKYYGKKESNTIPSPTKSMRPSEPKPKKLTMQQRLRSLWTSRVKSRSSDKAELVQVDGEDGKRD